MTTPIAFVGTPTITPEKLAVLKDTYVMYVESADKAVDLLEKVNFQATANTLESTLSLLYAQTAPIIEVVTKSKIRMSKPLIFVGVVGGLYLLNKQLDYQLRKIKLAEEANKAYKPYTTPGG